MVKLLPERSAGEKLSPLPGHAFAREEDLVWGLTVLVMNVIQSNSWVTAHFAPEGMQLLMEQVGACRTQTPCSDYRMGGDTPPS